METAEFTQKNDLSFLQGAAAIFGPNFLDESVCRAWVLNRLHPGGARCPGCGSRLHSKKSARFWQDKPVRCGCGKSFSARTDTALAGKT